MAKEKKSIIDEALLDVKRIQEALNANTKEILRSIAKEEIDGLVKESLQEDDYDEEDVDVDAEPEAGTEVDADTAGEPEVDADAEVTDADAAPVDAVDADTMAGSEKQGDSTMGSETGMDMEMSDLGDEIDMTSASDEDVISVYKKLTGNDEIEIVTNANGDIELTVNEPGQFVIKTNAGADTVGANPEVAVDDVDANGVDDIAVDGVADADVEDAGMENLEAAPEETPEVGEDEEEEEMEESIVYEIALDEAKDIESVKAPVGKKDKDNWAGDNLEGGFDDKGQNGKGDAHAPHIMEDEKEVKEEAEVKESEVNEAIPVGLAQGKRVPGKATPIKGAGVAKVDENVNKRKISITEVAQKYNKLLTEAKNLKKENDEFKESLKKFRTMLGETVVFNSNLTYVTKLFMEQSTTKEEKKQILKRFDEEVSSLKESKKLYKTIANELSSKSPINESIGNKITNNHTSGTSKINESTAYVDRDTKRIMDLIQRVERHQD